MKKILPSIVLVESIQSDKPRTDFSEIELDRAARLILETQCLVNPIIIRRIGVDSFKLIDGYFEYYSAVRAHEIDSQYGESINAFIAENDEEEANLVKQAGVFRISVEKKIRNTSGGLDTVLTAIRKIDEQLSNRESNFFDNMTSLIGKLIADQKKMSDTATQHPPSPSTTTPEERFLSDINKRKTDKIDRSFAVKLEKVPGLTKNIVKIIIAAWYSEPFMEFKSVGELRDRVKGVGAKSIEKILNYW